MNEFEIVHRYRRLAARGGVPDLECGSCGHALIVRLGKDDQPELKCYTCGVTTTVGVKMLMTLESWIDFYERGRV